MTFKLLSCDGGGIRGYLSCLMIQKLHQQSLVDGPNGSGKKIGMLDVVDGFAGTSTGGLISIALADARSRGADMTKRIDELVNIYANDGPKIFQENDWSGVKDIIAAINWLIDAINAWMPAGHKLKPIGPSGAPGIFAAQFMSSGVQSIAKQLVQDRALSSIADDLILAVNTVQLDAGAQQGWQPMTLSNKAFPNDVGPKMGQISLADTALSTSAAPTYFPPHLVTGQDGTDYGYFADGGTFANNPVMNGIEVALAHTGSTVKLDEIEVISIGTGNQPLAIDENTGKDNYWGLMQWFGIGSGAPSAALVELALSASAENETRIAEAVLQKRMARLNPDVPTSIGLATLGKTQEMFDVVTAYAQTAHWTPGREMAENWVKH